MRVVCSDCLRWDVGHGLPNADKYHREEKKWQCAISALTNPNVIQKGSL